MTPSTWTMNRISSLETPRPTFFDIQITTKISKITKYKTTNKIKKRTKTEKMMTPSSICPKFIMIMFKSKINL